MLTNKLKKMAIFMLMICFLVPFCITDTYASNQYDIIFRAGGHGSINGENKVTITVNYGDNFPDVPDVTVEEGYIFNGWDKPLPSVGSSVESKQVYVARYTRAISGQIYHVRYVDQNDVDLISPKVSLGELNHTITERAKQINNYPVDNVEKSITISNSKNEIVFVYTLPQDALQTSYITETVNVENTVPTNTNQQNTNTGTTDIEDTQIPLSPNAEDEQETKDIEDNQIPLASNIEDKDTNYTLIISSGVAIGIVILLALFVYKKKTKKI